MINEKVLQLMNKHSHIPKHKFIRYNGKPITSLPSLETLMNEAEDFTYAVGVLGDVPMFIGDEFNYHSNYQNELVTLMSVIYEDGEEDHFQFRLCSQMYIDYNSIVITTPYLNKLLTIKHKYKELVHISNTRIRNLLEIRDNLFRFNKPENTKSKSHPIEFKDSKGTSYWADSKDTVNKLYNIVQEISDDILAGIVKEGNIRVLSGATSISVIKSI